MNTEHASAIDNYVTQFETLTADNLTPMLDCFADNARFVDPFNDVNGHPAIEKIFAHMFETTDNPHFIVTQVTQNSEVALITWVFHMTLRKSQKALAIEGASQVKINAAGLVTEHIDFWDPCQGLYEHLPLIGKLFVALRRKVSVS